MSDMLLPITRPDGPQSPAPNARLANHMTGICSSSSSLLRSREQERRSIVQRRARASLNLETLPAKRGHEVPVGQHSGLRSDAERMLQCVSSIGM